MGQSPVPLTITPGICQLCRDGDKFRAETPVMPISHWIEEQTLNLKAQNIFSKSNLTFLCLSCVEKLNATTGSRRRLSPGECVLANHRAAHPYRDSPVLLRLLENIRRAHRRSHMA